MIGRWGKFNPERDFVARKAVAFGDVSYAPGDAVDKSVVPLRRLRQMFDAKTLAYGASPVKERSLVDMTTDERRAWFEARGGKFDARWSDARVLEAAHGLKAVRGLEAAHGAA